MSNILILMGYSFVVNPTSVSSIATTRMEAIVVSVQAQSTSPPSSPNRFIHNDDSHRGNVAIGIGINPSPKGSSTTSSAVAAPVSTSVHAPLLASSSSSSDHKEHDVLHTHATSPTSSESPFGPPKTCRWMVRIAVVVTILAFTTGVLVVKLRSSPYGGPPEQFHISLTSTPGGIYYFCCCK
jgi:hypothetical protein